MGFDGVRRERALGKEAIQSLGHQTEQVGEARVHADRALMADARHGEQQDAAGAQELVGVAQLGGGVQRVGQRLRADEAVVRLLGQPIAGLEVRTQRDARVVRHGVENVGARDVAAPEPVGVGRLEDLEHGAANVVGMAFEEGLDVDAVDGAAMLEAEAARTRLGGQRERVARRAWGDSRVGPRIAPAESPAGTLKHGGEAYAAARPIRTGEGAGMH